MTEYCKLKDGRYFGGKSFAMRRIINQIPPHDTFISCCLGKCAVLRYKRPAKLNIGFEPDKSVLRQWREAELLNGDWRFQFYNRDFLREDLQKYGAGKVKFAYIDPPYLPETIKSRHRYNVHMEREQHVVLLKKAKELDCMVAISHYPCKLYDEELKTWRRIDYQTPTRGGMAHEVLWMNYPEPDRLHDYTFLGEDYREREAVNLMKKRFFKKLDRMPTQHRNMLLNEIKNRYDLT